MNVENMYDCICLYLRKNDIDVDDSPVELFKLFDKTDGNGPYIGKWSVPVKEPTKKDLSYTEEEINEYIRRRNKTNKLKKLKDNELYKIVELLCLRLNIDINELLSEL